MRVTDTGKKKNYRNSSRILYGFLILGFSLLVTFIVYRSAWISEDSFITLRYVSNTLNGYGAVFNPGEFVQGYTHPLWFLLLLIGSAISHDEIVAATILSLGLTLSSLLLFGYSLMAHTNDPLVAVFVFVLACSFFISSDIWVSFQTGGLENALSHLLILLIITEAYFHGTERPGLLLLGLGLLCLSRPDYVFFALPFGVLILLRLRSSDLWGPLFATLPLVAWLLFAWWYYGSPLPNTGVAKLGTYSLKQGIALGLYYLADWIANDPVAAILTIAILVYCTSVSRGNRNMRVILIGMMLHLAWVISIGGDFMRGRFLMPVFTASIIVGAYEISRMLEDRSVRIGYAHALGLVLTISVAVFISFRNASDTDGRLRGFVANERKFYPGYSLQTFLRDGHLINPYLDLAFAGELRTYAEDCGPVTVHYRNPGTIGYLAGPNVTVIDTLGLTDRFIATLPANYLLESVPRPGHPDKYIPVQYLASRRDISLLAGWETMVRRSDCSLAARVEKLMDSDQYWSLTEGIVNAEIPPE